MPVGDILWWWWWWWWRWRHNDNTASTSAHCQHGQRDRRSGALEQQRQHFIHLGHGMRARQADQLPNDRSHSSGHGIVWTATSGAGADAYAAGGASVERQLSARVHAFRRW